MRTRTPETRTIGGFEVSTTRLEVTRALRLAPKIMKLLVPALPLVGLVNSGFDLANVDHETLVPSVTALLGALDDDMLNLLFKELLSDTSIIIPDESGRSVVCELNTQQLINIALGGLENGMTVLAEILLFAGEVNYKRSFFDLVTKVGMRKAEIAVARTRVKSTSPIT